MALEKRLGSKAVTMSPGCNNLALTTYGLCRHMRVNPLTLAHVDLLRSAGLLVMAKLKGSQANIVPLL